MTINIFIFGINKTEIKLMFSKGEKWKKWGTKICILQPHFTWVLSFYCNQFLNLIFYNTVMFCKLCKVAELSPQRQDREKQSPTIEAGLGSPGPFSQGHGPWSTLPQPWEPWGIPATHGSQLWKHTALPCSGSIVNILDCSNFLRKSNCEHLFSRPGSISVVYLPWISAYKLTSWV